MRTVWLGRLHLRHQAVREEELTGVVSRTALIGVGGAVHRATGVDLAVDVHGARAVPAGKDCFELDDAATVGELNSTQVGFLVTDTILGGRAATGSGSGVARVVAPGVTVPDLHRRVRQRNTRILVVDDGEPQRECGTGLTLGDVLAYEAVVQPVRTLGHLRGQHTGTGRRSRGRGSRSGRACTRRSTGEAGELATG